jgi:hypothetical protein
LVLICSCKIEEEKKIFCYLAAMLQQEKKMARKVAAMLQEKNKIILTL